VSIRNDHIQRPDAAPRIGPNAVLQTLRALRELEGAEAEERTLTRAELPGHWQEGQGMIPEAWFVRLVSALRGCLPSPRAVAVLRRAGHYTAEYVGRRRIPRLFRILLAIVPARLGLPLLIVAFRRHAWTFAGAGRFDFEGRFPGTLLLDGCPTCRDGAGQVSGGAGAYYEAAFQELLRLGARDALVREVDCQGRGARLCRFQVSLTTHPPVAAPAGVQP